MARTAERKHFARGVQANPMESILIDVSVLVKECFIYNSNINWFFRALVKKIGLDPLFEKNQYGQSPMTHRDYSIVEELLVIKDSDEFQILARFLLLRKARQAVQRVELLLPHFKAEDRDKIKAAEILKSMTDYGRRQDRFLGDIWFQAAKKFPQR
jgi:hypothetical protein